jgi:arylformamidase
MLLYAQLLCVALFVGCQDFQMPLYDLSVALSEDTPTYPGDPRIQIREWSTLAGGDQANVSLLEFGAHTGTHVDAPAHFLQGAGKVESLPLDILIGEAEVIEVPNSTYIIDEAFVRKNCKAGTARILFKTRNSAFWNEPRAGFRTDYTYLDPRGAVQLVERGTKLVGIDYLSIEQFKPDRFETHHILLSHRVIIVEGLDLRDVPAGKYELICLPLRIQGGNGDGAPARAVLRTLA